MYKINQGKAQMFTDRVLWQFGAELLSVVPSEGGWQCLSAPVCTASIMAHCKTNAELYIHFLPFSYKWKSFSDFFWLMKTGINVNVL